MKLFLLQLFIITSLLTAACLPVPQPPDTPIPRPSAAPTEATAPESGEAQQSAPIPEIGLRLIAGYLSEPTTLTHAGDGSGRLFVLERRGKIRLIDKGRLQASPFLDMTDVVNTDKDLEQGLLGLAFHPNLADDRRMFVYYTNRDDDTVLVSYHLSADLSQVDEESAQTLLTIEQPFTNHNGGQLVFGPDGYLYLGVGEGGLSKNPGPSLLLGKILRIDIDSAAPYAIPQNNPFADNPAYRPEIWDFGFRNPWRFSFDRANGDLYIADVGENLYEEVNIEPANSAGGLNYGWPIMEGLHCYERKSCNQAGLTLPVAEYQHAEDCSVTGGYVYRGAQYPALDGVYFFGDYCSGKIWGLRKGGQPEQLLDTIMNISSFGEDESGELYAVGFAQGNVYHLVMPSAEAQTNWPGAWPLADQPTEPVNVDFEGGIRLLGYSASQPLASPGAVIGLTLFWQGQSIPEIGNVFVQVRDKNNATVAQADHPLYISQDMLTADSTALRDGATLALPPDLPAGSYRLVAGFYDPESAQRLPVLDDQSGENAAIVAEFVVE